MLCSHHQYGYPAGTCDGNSLEVMEAIETLKGNGPADLTAVCLELAANMLYMAGKGSLEECRKLAEEPWLMEAP